MATPLLPPCIIPALTCSPGYEALEVYFQNYEPRELTENHLRVQHHGSITSAEMKDPEAFARLFQEYSALTLPNGLMQPTIAFLFDQPDTFITSVAGHLGWYNLREPIATFVGLFWLFYVYPLPLKHIPAMIAEINSLPDQELREIFSRLAHKSIHGYKSPKDRSQLLYLAYTGYHSGDINELRFLDRTTMWKFCYHEGLLGLSRENFPELQPFEESMVSRFCFNEIKDHVDFFHPLEKYRMEALPEEILPYLEAKFPRGVDALVLSYVGLDNVYELASQMGMVFPPAIKNNIAATPYFFQNLSDYSQVDLEKTILELDRAALKGMRGGLRYYSDQVLLEVFGELVPREWQSRDDLLLKLAQKTAELLDKEAPKIFKVVKYQDPSTGTNNTTFVVLKHNFIVQKEGKLPRRPVIGRYDPSSKKMVALTSEDRIRARRVGLYVPPEEVPIEISTKDEPPRRFPALPIITHP